MYNVNEICKLLDIKPHTLRYWEQEIPMLSQRKSQTGRKVYTKSEMQLLLRIKHLIYDKKYTLQGVKEQLWEDIKNKDPNIKSRINSIRSTLLDMLNIVKNEKEIIMDDIQTDDIINKLKKAGQDHIFKNWDKLEPEKKKKIINDLARTDLKIIDYFKKLLNETQKENPELKPIEYISLKESSQNKEAYELGEKMISEGKTAFLTVAGGQGSRLGYNGPKGNYPISPLRKATLFQIFAEKLNAAGRKYNTTIPWCIMTSEQNNDATIAFFKENNFFNLNMENVHFFIQGMLPSITPEGKLIIAENGGLFKNPDGHGGVVDALLNSGLLDKLIKKGIEELFHFQVDNPIVNVPDPLFLGFHRLKKSNVSSKVIKKRAPEEKLGVIGYINGKPGIIEYSDLDEENMYAKNENGELLFSQGSIAIHILNIDFLKKDPSLPFHIAHKKVKGYEFKGDKFELKELSGIKFEKFIFDTIPAAERTMFFETKREEEFSPLKNKTGEDSVETCIAGQVEKAALHLEKCGITVPRDKNGNPVYRIEISPLFALDLNSLKEKLNNTEIIINEEKLFI